MKYLKKFEKEGKLKTVKWSELGDSWSVRDIMDKEHDPKIFTGKKKLDTKLGQKVIDLLAEYNLYIVGAGKKNYLTDSGLVLPPEKKFKEYRITIERKYSIEEWLDYEGLEEEYKEDSKKIKSQYETYISTSGERDEVSWSVFLPLNTTEIEASAMADSTDYLRLISETYPDMFDNVLDYGEAIQESDKFKKFINKKKIQITNDNIEIISKISDRLRKDSKVFPYIKELGVENIQELVSKWLKIK